MTLLNTFTKFATTADAARRAVFEAAMVERLSKGEGYKMSDMLYELCDAQGRISDLEDRLETLEARFEKRAKKKSCDGS